MNFLEQSSQNQRFFIFRHGETNHTKKHIPYGDQIFSADILPEGIPVIKKLAEHVSKIPIDAAYSSPFKRTRQTVDIVAPITGFEFAYDERIGDYLDEEPMDKFNARIKSFIDEIRKTGARNALICTHGYPIAAMIQYITKGKIELDEMKNYPVPGVLVEIKGGKVNYRDFNSII